MRILVAMCTRDRDSLLDNCLRRLAEIDLPGGAVVEACVVINKASDFGGTLRVVSSHDSARLPMRAISEAKAGIPHARNAGLRQALDGGYTHVAFLDDDAYPAKDWLVELCAAMRAGNSASSGPQVPVFPEGARSLLSSCWVFRERRLPEGAATSWTATNNALVDVSDIRRAGLCFDAGLADSGGSDKLFFLQLTKASGKPVVWTNKAVVFEPVAASRLTSSWALRRAYRYGATTALINRKVHGFAAGLAISLGRSAGFAAKACARCLLATTGKDSLLSAASDLAYASGYLFGQFRAWRPKSYV